MGCKFACRCKATMSRKTQPKIVLVFLWDLQKCMILSALYPLKLCQFYVSFKVIPDSKKITDLGKMCFFKPNNTALSNVATTPWNYM